MGRAANFCGADGLEICEPLTFKGREGSGHPGGRNAYLGADTAKDWRKFAESYRLWGRLLYNPDATPDSWRRSLKRKFGARADAAERELTAASRVLPLLTSAHLPSASNHSLWYEMYTNQPIVSDSGFVPYTDTPSPRVFGTVSPLDPQLFSTITEHVDDQIAGRANAKYSPMEVVLWLNQLADEATKALAELGTPKDQHTRRLVEDVAIQIGIAQFFSAKLMAGVFYGLWQKKGDAASASLALACYDQASSAWEKMAERAKALYAADISYGEIPQRRGHWADRVPAIRSDLDAMRVAITSKLGSEQLIAVSGPIGLATQRMATEAHHVPVEHFAAGADLPVVLSGAGSASAQLFYRHVNHGERWQSLPMSQEGDSFRAAIPAAYTNSPYPLQYYFVLTKGSQAALYPGFNATFSNQPYFAVWKRG
jgi:hypothetical protein